MKHKNIVLLVIVLFMGMALAGGTYAWLNNAINVTNGVYNVASTCFLIDYSIDNGDGTQDISGTLFPTDIISDGLSGRVGFKINNNCSLDGLGTLNLHINSSSSSTLMANVLSYCENRSTLEPINGITNEAACTSAGGRWRGYADSYCESNATLERLVDYTNSESCTSHGGTWKSGGSPLKYAVYDNSAGTGTPLAKGYIESTDIGNDKIIYDNFTISSTQKYYYIFIWLDGYLVDNTVTNLPFSGYINASAIQVNDGVPSGYQRVAYIQSSGSEYIDTGVVPNQNTRVFVNASTNGTSGHTGLFGSRTSSSTLPFLSYIENSYGASTNIIRVDAGGRNGSTGITWVADEPFTIDVDIPNKKLLVNNTQISAYNNMSYPSSNGVDISIFAVHQGTSHLYPIVGKVYEFKIYDSGTLVRNFVPAKQGNVVGLYDNVNDVFYTNAGTGSFTAGPNV